MLRFPFITFPFITFPFISIPSSVTLIPNGPGCGNSTDRTIPGLDPPKLFPCPWKVVVVDDLPFPNWANGFGRKELSLPTGPVLEGFFGLSLSLSLSFGLLLLLLVVLPSRLSNNPMLCSVTCLWMCERVRDIYIQRPRRGDLGRSSTLKLSAASSKRRFIYLAYYLLLHDGNRRATKKRRQLKIWFVHAGGIES